MLNPNLQFPRKNKRKRKAKRRKKIKEKLKINKVYYFQF